MAAIATCSKCGAAARDDGTVVGGEDNCKRKVPPEDHNFFAIKAPQIGMMFHIFNIYLI